MNARRGQAVTEFSLVAPLLFFIILSIVEFGRAAYAVQILDNAAREGARYAIVHGFGAQCVNSRGPSGPMADGFTPPGCSDPAGAGLADPAGLVRPAGRFEPCRQQLIPRALARPGPPPGARGARFSPSSP